MKKLNLYLIAGLTGLCVLFSCNSPKAPEPAAAAVSQPAGFIPSVLDGSIVYVELDSLTTNYLMTKDLSAELEEKMNKLDADLTNRQKRFESNYADFRNKAEKGLETQRRLAEIEQQLQNELQGLNQVGEQYRMEMAEEQAVMQRKILQAIMDFLKEYNKEKGYRYILGNAFDAKILYADPSLDITAAVLDGINAKYKAETKK